MLDLLLRKKFVNNKSKKPAGQKVDKPVKSALKAVSWRIVGTLDTMLISFIMTGKIKIAISIGGIEVISKTILYYLHERFWLRINNFRIKRWTIKLKREIWN